MADRFFSLPYIGAERTSQVVEAGSAQAGNPVELRITYDAAQASKSRVLRALEVLRDRIHMDTWPPA